jgi:hypothetical protein
VADQRTAAPHADAHGRTRVGRPTDDAGAYEQKLKDGAACFLGDGERVVRSTQVAASRLIAGMLRERGRL